MSIFWRVRRIRGFTGLSCYDIVQNINSIFLIFFPFFQSKIWAFCECLQKCVCMGILNYRTKKASFALLWVVFVVISSYCVCVCKVRKWQ